MGWYKRIKDSKNKFLESCLAFHFSGKKNSGDCKIRVKSKPTVIYTLNNRKSIKIPFFRPITSYKT